MLNKLILFILLLCLPMCLTSIISHSSRPTTTFYHDYLRNLNDATATLNSLYQSKTNARKPNEYTQFYLNTQRQNASNNLINFFTNYRAYLHEIYFNSKLPIIKGYNYVRRQTTDLNSLENNLTQPIRYSLNYDQLNSNLIKLFSIINFI